VNFVFLSKGIDFSGRTRNNAHKRILRLIERNQWQDGENYVLKMSPSFCKRKTNYKESLLLGKQEK
jgi:hypothetical protein